MKNTLNLKLHDYRNSFNEPHIKKPYYLYVEWGNRNFYFSNRNKAERWLVKFRKASTELYREVNFLLFDNFKTACILSELMPFKSFSDICNDITWFSERYQKTVKNFNTASLEIGKELKTVYKHLIDQLGIFKEYTRKNGRFKHLYEQIRCKIKQVKRLKIEFDTLLTGADGIKEITNDKVKSFRFEKVVSVA